jgi:hypothetical protein
MGNAMLKCQRDASDILSSDLRQSNQQIHRRIEDLAEDQHIKQAIMMDRLKYVEAIQGALTPPKPRTNKAARPSSLTTEPKWPSPFNFAKHVNEDYEYSISFNKSRHTPNNLQSQATSALPPSALRLLQKYGGHPLPEQTVPVNVMTQTVTLPPQTQSIRAPNSPLIAVANPRNLSNQPPNDSDQDSDYNADPNDQNSRRRHILHSNGGGGGGGGDNGDPGNDGPNDPNPNTNPPRITAFGMAEVRPTIGEFKQLGLQFPPTDYAEDPSWMVRLFKNFKRAIITECNRTLTKNAKLLRKMTKATSTNFGCDWVSSSLMCLFSAHRNANNHDCNMKFKTEQNRLHDTAVTMEEQAIPDNEIFNWLKQTFIEIWATQRPAAYTAQLLRFQVCPGTSLEHALAALSAAVEVSRDVDTNPAQDATRVQAVMDVMADQFPSMHQFLLQSCIPLETSSLELMELLHTQREAKHRAGSLRYPLDLITNTAVFGDPVDKERRQNLVNASRRFNLRPRPAEINAIEESYHNQSLNNHKNANNPRNPRISRADAICTNCGERGHFWGTCNIPFNAPRHNNAASIGVPHAKDLEHFTRVQARIQGGSYNQRSLNSPIHVNPNGP